tara:strand:- start:183 stop:1019 length:837 start_codon:yes stop_codon:yes gene_type:complete
MAFTKSTKKYTVVKSTLIGSEFASFPIGTHISKKGPYYKTLTKFFGSRGLVDCPVQLFTGSPKSWRRSKLNEKDIEKTREWIGKFDAKVYIHSIYLINLAKRAEEIPKALAILRYDLELGARYGFLGVVVHCGKSLTESEEVAENRMYDNCISMLQYATEACPLLIETPAGQGTEILTKLESFSSFYGRFTPEQKKLCKLCIDTCHIFASGYEPMIYLTFIQYNHPGSIALVHYNDSKCPKGSCKDRHEVPGQGCIGPSKMKEVANWCVEHNVDMIYE